jgi:predicted glycosyltransferase
VLVWVDIENPPQVQYLLPFYDAFTARGAEVLVTARDYGITYDLLDAAGVEYVPVGASYGAGTVRKLAGVATRARSLLAAIRGGAARPSALIHSGRAAPLAARLQGIPAFAIEDYEHVDLTFDRVTNTFVLHPDVIPERAFRSRGISPDRLYPFRGLKEDISLGRLDVDAVEPYELPVGNSELVKVLVRPAAEESHYYRSASGEASRAVLAYLAARADAVVVFSPRSPAQLDALAELEWATEPLALTEAVPFLSLLKAVDLVVSSGGTMAREAAYLGIPSYTAFQGEPGAVDKHLASLGRLTFLEGPQGPKGLKLEKSRDLAPLAANPELLDELTDVVLARARVV